MRRHEYVNTRNIANPIEDRLDNPTTGFDLTTRRGPREMGKDEGGGGEGGKISLRFYLSEVEPITAWKWLANTRARLCKHT